MLRQDTLPQTVRPASVPRARDPVRWLVAAVVVLVVAVLALGAVLVQPMIVTTPGEALSNRVNAAWSEFNEQELRTLYTEDAFLWTNIDSRATASGIDEIVDTARTAGLKIQAIGPVSERGHLVWALTHVSSSYDISGSDEVTVFYVVGGRIAQQWVVWDELE